MAPPLSKSVLHSNREITKLGQNTPPRVSQSEVRNSRVTKSSYETELQKMTSHFELLPYSDKIWRGFNLTEGKNEIFGVNLIWRK